MGLEVTMRWALLLCLVSGLPAQEQPVRENWISPSTEFSGYVSTAYHFGEGGAPGSYALAPTGNTGFSLDVVGLSFRKPLDEWLFDAGYRVDLWAGPDASRLGFSESDDNTVELRQAYIDLRVPIADPRTAGEARSLDLRMGAFDSPLGYESPDRPLNAHYTHSWGFTIEPILHTGLMALYPGVDALENGESDYLLSFGVANTVEPRINAVAENADRQTWLSGLTWLVPDGFGSLSGSALSAGYTNGRTRTGPNTVQNLYLAAGLPMPSEAWNLAFTYDSRMMDGPGNDDSVLGAHLSYAISPDLTASLRAEWFQDGTKLFSDESAAEQTDGNSLTATLDYRLWENVTSRLEYRWDHTEFQVNDRNNFQSLHLGLIFQF